MLPIVFFISVSQLHLGMSSLARCQQAHLHTGNGVSSGATAMQLTPVMYEISSRMSNETLEALSHTALWPTITDAARHQIWWYMRAEWLLERPLEWQNGDWRNAYKSLLKVADKPRFDADLDYSNPLLVSVLLDIGANPVEQTTASKESGWQVVRQGRKMSYIRRPLMYIVRDGNIASVSRMLEDNRIGLADLRPGASVAINLARDDILELLLADSRMTERLRALLVKQRDKKRAEDAESD